MNDETIKSISGALEETAKLGQESVKASRELAVFFSKFVTEPLEQASGLITDRLKYHRITNQIKFKIEIEKLTREFAIDPTTREIPFKHLLPLIESASLENDDTLRKMWAMLLLNFGNSSSGIEIRASYIEILKSLSSLEVQILNSIYSIEMDYQHKSFSTRYLPERIELDVDEEEPLKNPDFTLTEDVEFALANLERIGCLSAQMTWGGGRTYRSVHPTIFGKSFVKACKL